MKAVGRTDNGRVRGNNEDSFFVCDGTEDIGALPNLFIVADGMGGHNAGEVASQSAVLFFCEYVKNNSFEDGELLDFMTDAVRRTNMQVYEKSCTRADYTGMGTTFSAAVVSGGKVFSVHIGDSRIYLARDGKLTQLTNDHTYVCEMIRAGQLTAEEAQVHPNKNALTRALGIEALMPVDARVDKLEQGDLLLLCSDGLSNMVDDEKIRQILCGDESDVDKKAESLVDAANQRGGADNITVVLIRI